MLAQIRELLLWRMLLPHTAIDLFYMPHLLQHMNTTFCNAATVTLAMVCIML